MTAPVPSSAAPAAGSAGAPAGLGDLTATPVAGPVLAEVGEPSPAPTGAPAGGFEAWEVSPGLIGFVPVFLIALACVGLFLSLTRQMRRVTARQAQRDAEDAEALRRAGPPEDARGDEAAGGDGAGPR